MKQITIVFLMCVSILSCNNNDSKSEYVRGEDPVKDIEVDRIVKQTLSDYSKQSILDSAGMDDCPVEVYGKRLIKKEYSNYKDIALDYKNVSDKTIQAIRFEWYGENAFGEPADMGTSFIEGRGGGFSDDKLRPGGKRTSQWEILSINAKNIISARAIEVAFTDGTKWELEQ